MAFWVGPFLLATAASGGAMEPPPPLYLPPTPIIAETSVEDIDIIQARRDRYERMTVPVTIDGGGPYRFMIDTGAQATVIASSVSEELALPHVGSAILVGIGSIAPVDIVHIDTLSFANREFHNIEAPRLLRSNMGADGILGLDSLQDLRVLIDLREDRISVASAHQLGGNLGYEIVVRARRKLGQMVITNARIDGIRAAVLIDTGAQTSLGNAALKRRLRARRRSLQIATDVNGAEFIGEVDFARRLKIGRLELANVPISFVTGPAFATLGLGDRPALILGMDALRVFDRVAIDFASRRVLFDLPGHTQTQDWRTNSFFPSRIES